MKKFKDVFSDVFSDVFKDVFSVSLTARVYFKKE